MRHGGLDRFHGVAPGQVMVVSYRDVIRIDLPWALLLMTSYDKNFVIASKVIACKPVAIFLSILPKFCCVHLRARAPVVLRPICKLWLIIVWKLEEWL